MSYLRISERANKCLGIRYTEKIFLSETWQRNTFDRCAAQIHCRDAKDAREAMAKCKRDEQEPGKEVHFGELIKMSHLNEREDAAWIL